MPAQLLDVDVDRVLWVQHHIADGGRSYQKWG